MSKLTPVPDFPALEKKWLEEWENSNLYSAYLEKNNKSEKKFSFIDGPITANNPMGVHHGWGRTYKDLWQKFHNLLGEKQRFQNGFDCQGLWVEVEVEKQLGIRNKKDIENLVPGNRTESIAKFVNLCKQRVEKYSTIQTQQSMRLGYFMDWDNSYFTMSDENNYTIWHFLKTVHKKGWLYQGTESVPWCPRCETAISQHEMLTEDYKEVVHDSIYLKLPVVDHPREFLIVWTTTPWTIPANIAVAVDSKLDYSLVKGTSGDSFWVAADTVGRLFGKNYEEIIKTVKGSKLVGLTYTAPFDQLPAVKAVAADSKFHTVVQTDDLILPITTSEGTGLVHTAVSAGVEDFKLGKKYNLPMIPVINDDASYMEGLGFLSGKNAKKHPEIIIEYLHEEESAGRPCLFDVVKYKHRYPACWRCKTELVWKVTDEWYIAMDTPDQTDIKKRTFREQMIETVKKITWIPEFGLDRELDWLKNMHDWLISKKNRYWGLALPIYECSSCKYVSVIGSKEELQKRAHTGWSEFEGNSPHKPWIDHVTILCEKCGAPVSRINDVGNVWLDAGIVPFSTLHYLSDTSYWDTWFPADLVTESFPGQFKNWFYSMIAMATALEGTNAFKSLLGYATVLDQTGKPMHKSWGNMIEFNEAADKMGVDVMRWLYCRQDPTRNLLFGYGRADEVKRAFHLPLWNSLLFFLTYAELDSWKSSQKEHTLSLLDTWIMANLHATIEKVYSELQKYRTDSASLALEQFVSDLSQWYIRSSRNRVWNNSEDDLDKDALYATLSYCLEKLSIVLSPFLPFFSEEIHSHLVSDSHSVHLEKWPQNNRAHDNANLLTDMAKVRELAELGHRSRKELNLKVRQVLASATYSVPEKYFSNEKAISEYELLLSRELNVKKVHIIMKKIKTPVVELDTALTPELIREGRVREMIREIQSKRKELGCAVTDTVTIVLPKLAKDDAKIISRKVLAREVQFHDNPAVLVKK